MLLAMEAPRLLIEDLVLEPPTIDDAPAWAAAQDDECAIWFDWPSRPTTEQCLSYLRRITLDAEPDSYVWAIRVLDGFAGGIDLKFDEGRWNVSYFVAPARRGRGIARRALCAVVEWAERELCIAEISTRVHVDNIASQRVLEAAGFTRIRTQRSPGADHDDHICARTFPPALRSSHRAMM